MASLEVRVVTCPVVSVRAPRLMSAAGSFIALIRFLNPLRSSHWAYPRFTFSAPTMVRVHPVGAPIGLLLSYLL